MHKTWDLLGGICVAVVLDSLNESGGAVTDADNRYPDLSGLARGCLGWRATAG